VEKQMLVELVQIKWILFAIFIAVAIAIIYMAVSIAFRIRSANTQTLLMVRDNFIAELSLLESKGEYETLQSKADEMVSMYPNDVLANWYCALGNHRTKQYGAALSALGRIRQANPTWNAEIVNMLIDEIKSEMGGPRAGGT
jgi:hypothetical protein